jgi:hypothetical protein
MAGPCLRCTAALIFVMAVVVGSGPPYAQRHDAGEFASLRGEASELYSQGKYTKGHSTHGRADPEFETAIGLLASVFYGQAV